MVDDPADDVMAQSWCCLACSRTFRFGQIQLRGPALHCPACEATDLHSATGEIVHLDSYGGEIGTLN